MHITIKFMKPFIILSQNLSGRPNSASDVIIPNSDDDVTDEVKYPSGKHVTCSKTAPKQPNVCASRNFVFYFPQFLSRCCLDKYANFILRAVLMPFYQ